LEAVYLRVPCQGYIYNKDQLPLLQSLETAVKKEKGFGVRWTPTCEEMNPGAEECLSLQDITEQSSEDRD
jgi:hypothetical protein